MAVKYAPWVGFSWSGNWCIPDDGTADEAPPGPFDEAHLTDNSGNCNMDQNSGDMQDLIMTGYTGTFDFNTYFIDSSGNVIFDGTIVADAGAEIECSDTFNTSAAVLPATLTVTLTGGGNFFGTPATNQASFVVDAVGTFTCVDTQYWGDYRWKQGIVDWASKTAHLYVSGNIDWADATSRIYNLHIDSGATGTLTNTLYVHILDGSGTLDVEAEVIDVDLGFDGTNLTVVGVALGEGHAEVHGGTVLKVSLPLDDAALDATDGVVDGGGNVNVWLPGTPGIHAAVGNGIIGAGRKVA